MMLGLKRGTVKLYDHQMEWEKNARETIQSLKAILGDAVIDIQHVGSTAIKGIKAKPIIDIAVGVIGFEALNEALPRLEANGFHKSSQHAIPNDLLYVSGDIENDMRTHHIHIVSIDSVQWHNYINFRNYLNEYPQKSADYEALKIDLAQKFPDDRISYTDGKEAFIEECLFEARIYSEIRKKFDIVGFEPITEGWSVDKKYCITTTQNERYLLRISPLSLYETKKVLFSMMEKIAALDIPMCLPVKLGTYDDGVYCIYSWIEGVDLDTVLSSMSETEQYLLGIQAGKYAKKIHSIPVPEPHEEWAAFYSREIDTKIKEYKECGLSFKGDSYVLDYIEKNRHLLINRPQCYLIWDYHIRNMMYEKDEVKLIDFEYYNIGDPWNEFSCIVWSAAVSPHFATGQIHGYFGGQPPKEFFKLLALYNTVLLLSLLSSWAVSSDFGCKVTLDLSQNILKWFDNMNNPVPSWYEAK